MARKLDPDFEYTRVIDATVRVWTDFDWDRGEQEMINLLEINPNHALLRSAYAHLLLLLKRDEEAMKQADLALELDPLNPMILSFYAIVAASIGNYEKAIEVGNKAYSIAPEHGVAHHAMAIAHVYKGDYKSALNSWIDEFYLDENTRQIVLNTYDEKGYEMAALLLAEETKKSVANIPSSVAYIYASAGNSAKAMDFFEQAYEEKDANLPYIGRSMLLDGPFKIDDPRFVELLKKMNFPLE
jgi:tetratricopeptide (TPR) repeat protein